MSDICMPVKSRLQMLILDRSKSRVESGGKPWSLRAVAKAAGVSPAVVGGLASGKAKRVDFESLSRLCSVLDCQPGDILVYSPDASPADTN